MELLVFLGFVMFGIFWNYVIGLMKEDVFKDGVAWERSRWDNKLSCELADKDCLTDEEVQVIRKEMWIT